MSCCRKPPQAATGKDYCSSISMATAVTFRNGSSGIEATLTTPSGERLPIPAALEKYACTGKQTAGIKLAEIVNRALLRAVQEKPDALIGMLNRQMPLLMAKEKLFALVDRCGSCNGVGCSVCNNTGFRP